MLKKSKKEYPGDPKMAHQEVLLKLEKKKLMRYQLERYRDCLTLKNLKREKEKFARYPRSINKSIDKKFEKEIQRQIQIQKNKNLQQEDSQFQIRLWAIDALIKRAAVYEQDRANWSLGYQVIQDTDMYEFEQNLLERENEL
jgi:hypothetical protein